MAVRVVIAEDEALLREGLASLLERIEGVELVGAATNLPELLELVDAVDPDVVVTDIRMPPTKTDEGVRAATELRVSRPDVGIVLLSHYASPRYAAELLEAGSSGCAYLLKEHVSNVDQLADAIKKVAAGGSIIDPTVVEELVRARSGARQSSLNSLTPREREVLEQIAQGKSNAAVAKSLYITERAVEKHSASIFSKLGLVEEPDVNRRVKAVIVYLAETSTSNET